MAQREQATSTRSWTLVKARRKLLLVVVVFCLCFVPYHLVRLPYIFLKRQCSGDSSLFFLKELVIMVSTFNICLDPLIYFIFCKAFRARLSRNRQYASSQNKEWVTSAGNTQQEVSVLGKQINDTGTAETQLYYRTLFKCI